MAGIFVSFSSLDRDLVRSRVVELLERHGLTVWWSHSDLAPGDKWEPSIKQGLAECEWFVVALSANSVQSKWVRAEVDWALEHRDGKLVPVLISDCDPHECHLLLRRIQLVDLRRGDRSEQAKLLQAIGGVLSAPAAETPAVVQSDGVPQVVAMRTTRRPAFASRRKMLLVAVAAVPLLSIVISRTLLWPEVPTTLTTVPNLPAPDFPKTEGDNSPAKPARPGDQSPEGQAATSRRVDLLKLLDIKRDTVEGEWSLNSDSTVLKCQPPAATIEIPYIPPAEYDMRISFVRLQQNPRKREITAICYAHGRQFHWGFEWESGDTAGINLIEGKNTTVRDVNKTGVHRREGWITVGKLHTMVCKVRDRRIQLLWDHELVVDYPTDFHEISRFNGYPHDNTLGLRAQGLTEFRSVELIEVSGTGRPLGSNAAGQ